MSDVAPAWSTADITKDLMVKLRRDSFLAVAEAMLDGRSMQRADVLAMHRKLEDRAMLIFEIKTSRADLMGDLKREKWRGYLSHGAVAFAFATGLARPHEIPIEAGVIVRSASGWTWKRGPRWAQAPRPTAYLYRRMALSASDQSGARARATLAPREASLWHVARHARSELGRRIATGLEEHETWNRIVADQKLAYNELLDDARRLREQIAKLYAERRALERCA